MVGKISEELGQLQHDLMDKQPTCPHCFSIQVRTRSVPYITVDQTRGGRSLRPTTCRKLDWRSSDSSCKSSNSGCKSRDNNCRFVAFGDSGRC